MSGVARNLFTSDPHYGHPKIQAYCPGRPQGSLDEMNELLVENWNAVVGPRDTVWVLGDVAMGNRDETLQYVERLNGHKLLVAGNHDKCWAGNRKVGDWPQRYLDAGFEEIHTSTEMTVAGRPVLLHHFPYAGDHTETDRYVEHRPVDRGRRLLHGHVHDRWQVNGRMINVGVDVHSFFPVSEEEIAALIENSTPGDAGYILQ